jgi:hypothetical protein
LERPKEHAGGASEPAPKATQPSTLKWIVEFPHPTLYGKTKVLSLDDYRRQDRLGSSDQEFDDYPILLRHALNESGETNKYQLELQSKELKDYFGSIAKPYRQINVDADPIVIARPFRPLFFLRDTMKQKAESNETSPELKQHINAVLDFINSKEGLHDVVKKYEDQVPHKKISFDMLWALYPPHELVYHHESKSELEQCFLIEDVWLKKANLTMEYVFDVIGGGHDGKVFGLYREELILPRFIGTVDINTENLPIIPMKLLEPEKRSEIRSRLIQRGMEYVALSTSKFSYKQFQGRFWAPHAEESKMSLQTDDMSVAVSEYCVYY